MDIIFENVMLYDGSGDAGKICNVGVEGDRIKAIGDLGQVECEKRIDCTGLSMIPGMIDVHTHSDLVMFTSPGREMALTQGITTEIISACGCSFVPLSGELLQSFHLLWSGLFGALPKDVDFSSVDGYFSSLPKIGVNVAMQVGHSALRTAAVGSTRDEPYTDEVRKRMQKIEAKCLEDGAVSISTGMSYFPASFSDTNELIDLGNVATEYGVPFSVHRRDAMRRHIPGFDSCEEVLDVARAAKTTMVFSHYRTGPWNPGHHKDVCRVIERGLDEGLDIHADFYPYDHSCTYTATMATFDMMKGGAEGLLDYLNDEEKFEQFVADREKLYGGYNGRITLSPKHPEYQGRTFKEIAGELGISPERLALQLIRDERMQVGNVGGTVSDAKINKMLDEDFAYFLTRPYYNVGSDTIPSYPHPHPRSYGAFAKILRIARDENVGLERIAVTTAASAAKLYGLRDRGMVKEGYFADLAVFDAATVTPHSTYENPTEYATGMKYVTVNGSLELENGVITGARSGRALKRNK